MKKKKPIETDLDQIILLLIGIWRRYRKENGPPDVLQTREFRGVVSAVIALKQGLEEDKTLIGTDYFQKPEFLGGYLLYQWVLHYLEAFSIIGELPFVPQRVLDVCSGPGSMSFAALKHGATEVYATDRNVKALEIGAEVSGRYGMPSTIRRWDCLKEKLPIEGKFDLIILGYCLEELFPITNKHWEEEQTAFLEQLLERLTPNGYLMLVESSFGDVNRRVLKARDQLVKKGVPVQAPCVWRGECPALQTQNSPCYAQREFEKPYLIKEIQRAAQINLSSLKMSYLILKNPQASWPEPVHSPLYRIISPPFESHHSKSYYLCGTDGKKKLSSHLNDHPRESRAFEYLRRGELIHITNELSSRNSMEIVQGTHLTVEAACGKPIPEKESREE